MIKYLSKPGFYRFENAENKETEYSDGLSIAIFEITLS